MTALDVYAQLVRDRLELGRAPASAVRLDRVPPELLLQLVAVSDAAVECLHRVLLCVDPRLPRDARTMARLMRDHVAGAYSPSPHG